MLRKVALVCCALLLASCATIGVPQPTPTVAPTLTPSRTLQQTALAQLPTRTPLPTATATDAPTLSATPNPSETGTSTATPTDTLTPTPTLSETPTTTATLTPSLTSTATTTPTVTPTATDTAPPSNTPLPRFEPTATVTLTPTPTNTLTPTVTPSLSPTPSDTFTPEPTNTFTPSATFTPSLTFTPQPSSTFTATITSSATSTVTATTTPSVTVSSTSGPPSTTPTLALTATATIDPFYTTEAPTWTPFPTGTATPTVTTEPGPTLDVTPTIVTLEPSDPAPVEALPTDDTVQGEPTQETFQPTPTTVYPTVEPVAPPPTLEFAPVPVRAGAVSIGSLPFSIGPVMTGADFSIPGASDDYAPFQLINPVDPNQSVMTDEFGAMYWVRNGERTPLPEPFSSFGPDSLENSDRLVRAAAWSPDGSAVAFVVDNARRGDANDGVWWWEVGTGRAYQVMHNCRRNIRNCGDFVNATGDPYINPPADQAEQPNTGWYAQSVSWSPDGTRLLARLRIRDDQRLAFIVLPATMDENWKRQRGDVCKYELSDWSADGSAVLVAGRDPNDILVLGRIEEPNTCSGFVSLEAQAVVDTRVTPIAAQSAAGLPEGVVAGSEFAPNQQLQVNSTTGGLNLRTQPAQSAPVHRYVLNGEYVRVLAGPYDSEGYRWWRVQTSEGTQGWMAGSSAGSQLLVPVP